MSPACRRVVKVAAERDGWDVSGTVKATYMGTGVPAALSSAASEAKR